MKGKDNMQTIDLPPFKFAFFKCKVLTIERLGTKNEQFF